MPSASELEFLVKMRDEASAILNRMTQAMGSTAQAAQGLSAQFQAVTAAAAQMAGAAGQMAGAAAQITAAVAQSTQAIKAHTAAAKSSAAGLNEFLSNAQAAATAVAELWASVEVGRGALDTFREYELNMVVVEKVTKMGKEEMKNFEAGFDALAKKSAGLNVDQLGHVAGQAAQLGIRGTDNILKFTETMARMSLTTATLGEDASKDFARVLIATGDASKGAAQFGQAMDDFANILTALGQSSAATEGQILQTAKTVAQATSQFHLGTPAVMGFSSAIASMGLEPRLAATAMSRTLIALRDAAMSNTAPMRELTQITGITADEFKKMVRDDPGQAFMTVVDVLKKMNAEGKSTTAFLTGFKLQSQENVRVLGTLAENTDMVRKALAAAYGEVGKAPGEGASDKEAKTAMGSLNAQITVLQNNWDIFKKDFGEALAPAAEAGIRALTAALQELDAILKAIPEGWRGVAAWTVVGTTAIAGVVTALRPLMALFGMIGEGFAMVGGWLAAIAGSAFWGMLRTIAVAVFMGIVDAIGVAVGAIGAVPVAIIAALAVAAGAVYVFYDDIKAFFADLWNGDDSAKAALKGKREAEAYKAAQAAAFDNWKDNMGRDDHGFHMGSPTGHGVEDANPKAKKGHGIDETPVGNTGDTLLAQYEKALEGLDAYSKMQAKVVQQEQTLEALRKLKPGDTGYRDAGEIARLQVMINLEKERANPVTMRLQGLDKEMTSAGAMTAAAKLRLAVEQDIKSVIEKRGAISAEEAQSLADGEKKLAATRQAAALVQNDRQFTQQLASAQAVTAEEKTQVEVAAKINDLEQQHGALTEKVKENLRAQIEVLNQTKSLHSLEDNLDSQSAALRKYTEDVRVLNQALADGDISAEKFNAMLGQLNRNTLASRDPWGAQVKSMRDQIQLQQISGEYQDADRSTQEKINELTQKGVQVTKEQAQAMQDYNRAMADAKKEESSGFKGWANSIGSVKDGLLGLEKDFASGLSSAISGALQGKKGEFHNLLSSMGGKMVDFGVNQMMKQTMEGSGLTNLFSSNPLGKAKDATDKLSGLNSMTTGSMSVQATSVTISGAGTLTNAPSSTSYNGVGTQPNAQTNVQGGTITPSGTALPTIPNLSSTTSTNTTVPTTPSLVSTPGATAPTMAAPLSTVTGLVGTPASVPGTSAPTVTTSQLPNLATSQVQSVTPQVQSIAPQIPATPQVSTLAPVQSIAPQVLQTATPATGPVTPQLSQMPPIPQTPQLQQAPVVAPQVSSQAPALAAPVQSIAPQVIKVHTQAITADGTQVQTPVQPVAPQIPQSPSIQQLPQIPTITRSPALSSLSTAQVGPNGMVQVPTAAVPPTAQQQLLNPSIDRSALNAQLADPATKNKLMAYTQAEVGNQGPVAQQGFMEATLNRTLAKGGDINKTLGTKYYPPITHERAQDALNDPDTMKKLDAKYDGMLKKVQDGSNISNYGTGNASGDPSAFGKKGYFGWGGTEGTTLKSHGESIGIEKGTEGWVQRQKLEAQQRQLRENPQLGQTTKQPLPGQTGVPDLTKTTANMGQLNTQQLTQAQNQMKQATTSMTQNLRQTTTGFQQLGQQTTQAIPKLSQMDQGITKMGTQTTQAIPQMTNFSTQGLGQMTQGLQQAAPATSSFTSSLSSMVSQMGKGFGGGGLFAGLFHGGGEVDGSSRSGKVLSMSAVSMAPRFHSGLNDDEYPAVLQRGERVLTANDNQRNSSLLKGLTDRVNDLSSSQSSGGGKVTNQSLNVSVTTQDANSFRRSQGQLMADAHTHMNRMSSRNN